MCGIGLIIAPAEEADHMPRDTTELKSQICEALQRRGDQDETNIGEASFAALVPDGRGAGACPGPGTREEGALHANANRRLNVSLLSSVLHLRGQDMIRQPVQRDFCTTKRQRQASSTLAFCWNGECYGVASDSNTDIEGYNSKDTPGADQGRVVDTNSENTVLQAHEEVDNNNLQHQILQEDEILQMNDTEFVFDKFIQRMTHSRKPLSQDEGGDNHTKENALDVGKAIATIMGNIKGEYSFLLLHRQEQHEGTDNENESITTHIYFGRDGLGRRSLLMSMPMSSLAAKMEQVENDDNHPLTEHNTNVNEALQHFPHQVSLMGRNAVVISSVAPSLSKSKPTPASPSDLDNNKWIEVPPGLVFCLSPATGQITWTPIIPTQVPVSIYHQSDADDYSNKDLRLVSAITSLGTRLHNSPIPNISIPPNWNGYCNESKIRPSMVHAAQELYTRLSAAVRRRVIHISSPTRCSRRNRTGNDNEGEDTAHAKSHTIRSSGSNSSVGILFSGGLDSVVLAAMSHAHVPLHQSIDLMNVAFYNSGDGDGTQTQNGNVNSIVMNTPDRAAALVAYEELCQSYPDRTWNFVAVDVNYRTELKEMESHILSLIHPKCTHMDFNIGAAMWFASRGRGMSVSFVDSHSNPDQDQEEGKTKRDTTQTQATRQSTTTNPICTTKALLAQVIRCKGSGGLKKENDTSALIACSRHGCDKVGNAQCAFKACTFCCTCYQKPINRFLGGSAGICTIHNNNNINKVKGKNTKKEKEKAKQKQGAKQVQEQEVPPSIKHDVHKNEENEAELQNLIATRLSCRPYTSHAKVLLVGIGADEQMAGYGRHRSTFRRGGESALRQELTMETCRLWQRNLGRDDRCISDHGKEARFPFLDEDVMSFLASLPMHDICDFQHQPPGVGDKMILRLVAAAFLKGTTECSVLEKRAIQFGSRIAKLSDQHAAGAATVLATQGGGSIPRKAKASGTSQYVATS
jgi:asparagine synthetase B (glutamine-hydrolysing)